MRLSHLTLIASLTLTACGDSNRPSQAGGDDDGAIDAGTKLDAAVPLDAPDVGSDGIDKVIAAADGTVALQVHATVTYLKPLIPGATSDPAGFTIQGTKTGPAIFVAIDPATLAPPAQVGDVVDFTVTQKTTVSRQPRATAIATYTRAATGTDVGLLTQDLTNAADVLTNLGHYDSELVTITGTLVSGLTSGGGPFLRASINTAGLTGDANYQLRMPSEVTDEIDLMQPCQFTVTRVPMGQFQTQAQIAAFRASDIQLSHCPAPTIASVTATSATTIVVTLSRNVLASSIKNPSAQFTISGTGAVMAAVASGRTITLTALGLVASTSYNLTIASSVTDLAGSSVTPGSASFTSYGSSSSTTGAQLSVHTTLGIPGPLSTTPPSDYFQSVKPLYVVSYNGTRRVPNWVSWELNSTYLGAADRSNDFRVDDTFPATEPQAALGDYSGSGWERGHMCPSADRTDTSANNSQTFYLTNMVPQSANNNEGPWANLENYARSLVGQGKELFIISGPIFSATSGTIGTDHVAVPDATWKVIVVLDSPTAPSPAKVTTSTRVISVIMPNNNTDILKNDDWHNFRTTVDQIEAKTALDLLSDVDPAVQAVIEARVDNLP